jgi:hypothetical protein
MTTIYIVENPAQQTVDYICDSQDTIAAGQALDLPGNFSIGDESIANNILISNTAAFLEQQIDNFVVYKSTANPDDSHTWEVCDLSTELSNEDVQYNFINYPNGDWITATGISNAQTMLDQIKQNTIAWAGLSSYATLTEWSIPRKTTRGTQTL